MKNENIIIEKNNPVFIVIYYERTHFKCMKII